MNTLLFQISLLSVSIVLPSFSNTSAAVPNPKTMTMLVATNKDDASPYSFTGNHLLITIFWEAQMIEFEKERTEVPTKIGKNDPVTIAYDRSQPPHTYKSTDSVSTVVYEYCLKSQMAINAPGIA